MKNNKTKKIFAVLISVALVLSLALLSGCSLFADKASKVKLNVTGKIYYDSSTYGEVDRIEFTVSG